MALIFEKGERGEKATVDGADIFPWLAEKDEKNVKDKDIFDAENGG